MKGLHTGTEKAEPTWKEWRREFCCRRLEGAWAARWERELYPRA